MGLGVGRRNRSTIRELAGELRDEGDEGVGRRAREKKNGGRKKKEKKPERERENRKCLFNERGERSVINFYFFYLPLSYNARIKIDVQCICEAKIFRFSFTAAT